MSDFKKVVNLSMPNASQDRFDYGKKAGNAAPVKKVKSKAEDIDKVYGEENNTGAEKRDFGKIERPIERSGPNNIFKAISAILILVVIALIAFYFLNERNEKNTEKDSATTEVDTGRWYSVQLTSGEIFYGFIKDTKADPIVLEKVFYNYDQINKTDKTAETENQNNSIRLVKRGKESHGPDGTMNVVRSQALYLEPLSDDSKILKAIIEYEKQ